jgi:hypothetical protein
MIPWLTDRSIIKVIVCCNCCTADSSEEMQREDHMQFIEIKGLKENKPDEDSGSAEFSEGRRRAAATPPQ